MAKIDPERLTRIGRYPVRRFVAQGGMSWVFEVEDANLFHTRRALKLLKPDAAVGKELKRFEREVKLLANVQHPNLIHVYDFGRDEATGCHYYTMDFVDGDTLGDIQPSAVAPDPEATRVDLAPAIHSYEQIYRYFTDVLGALGRLHDAGIVHRDIKPQNVFVSNDGHVTLGDLGIAKETGAAGETQAGVTPGTPLYMSPEQSLGHEVTVCSDIFSVGLSLYRVLTGRTVYDDAEEVESTNSQAVLRHLWSLQGTSREFVFFFPPDVPEAVREVVRRACRMQPAERYTSAGEMARALRDAMYGASAARDAAVTVSREQASRAVWIGGGVTALLAVAAVAFGVNQWMRSGELLDAAALLQEIAEGERAGAIALVERLRATRQVPDLLGVAERELRFADDQIAEGLRDRADESYRRAARMFEKASVSYAKLCDELFAQHLGPAMDNRLHAARAAVAGVPEEAADHLSDKRASLATAVAALGQALPDAGCARAEASRTRIEEAVGVIALATRLAEEMDAFWPELAERRWVEAAEARDVAAASAIDLDAYRELMKRASKALDAARRSLGRAEHRSAYESASDAGGDFDRAATALPAFEIRAEGHGLLEQIDKHGIEIGALENHAIAANEAWEANRWSDAEEDYQTVVAGVSTILADAAPVIAKLVDVEEARRATLSDDGFEIPLGESDRLREEAIAQLQNRRFDVALQTAERAELSYNETGREVLEAARRAAYATYVRDLDASVDEARSRISELRAGRATAARTVSELEGADPALNQSKIRGLVRELRRVTGESAALERRVESKVTEAEGSKIVELGRPEALDALIAEGDAAALLGLEVGRWESEWSARIRAEVSADARGPAARLGSIVDQKSRAQRAVALWNAAWSERDWYKLSRVRRFASAEAKNAARRALEQAESEQRVTILETNKLSGPGRWECIVDIQRVGKTWWGAERPGTSQAKRLIIQGSRANQSDRETWEIVRVEDR